MRILYYSPHPTLRLESLSGYGTHMRAMIRAFRELGHEVEALILGDLSPPASPSGVPRPSLSKRVLKRVVPRIGWNSLKDLSMRRFDRNAARALRDAIERHKPALVYERAAYLQVSGVATCKQLGIPHVLELNSPYAEERGTLGGPSLLTSLGVRAERQQLHETTAIATVSSTLRDHMADRHGVPLGKFVVTPNAIFPEDHEQSHLPRRRPDGVPDNAPLIGFAGSIFRWHGLDVLIRALHLLPMSDPAPHVVIIGSGEPLPELKALAHELGLSGRVHFTGSVPHARVFEFLAGLDIAVLPASHWYGSPVKLFEYGALGLPIVAIRNGPVSEVMVDGQHGLLTAGGASDLVAALSRMLDDMTWARSLGESFRTRVLTEYTWSRNAQSVLAAAARLPWPAL